MTNSARVIQWGLVALLIWIAGASGAAISSAQTAPPYWPDGEWRTSTPEEQGLDSMVLAGMLEGVRAANIDSVLVIRHGYAVLDAYTHPFHADALRSLHSAAKGFTAALVGIAWLAAPRGIPARALGGLWLLPLFVVVPPRPGAGEMEQHYVEGYAPHALPRQAEGRQRRSLCAWQAG